ASRAPDARRGPAGVCARRAGAGGRARAGPPSGLGPTGAGDAGAAARIRSSPRHTVSRPSPAAAARNGLARPYDWTRIPDRAGPITPPTPALATVPPSPGPPGAASASQDSPAVETMA